MKSAIYFLSVSLLAAPLPVANVTVGGFAANRAPASEAPHYCVVYDGAKVLQRFSTAGITATRNHLFCATTEAEIDAQIANLHLIPLPPAPAPPGKVTPQ